MADTRRVRLPVLHSGQHALFLQQQRLNAVRCGRRWGKTRFLEWLAAKGAGNGQSVGIFAPEHKQLAEPWDHLRDMLDPIIKSANRNDGTIKLLSGGKIDFWTLNDNELAGRGREYNLVLIDEAGFTKSPQMKSEIWFKSIKPTMLTTRGVSWVFSTPNGLDPDNFFYAACQEPDLGFSSFHAPTSTNPYVPLDELERERERNHPMVFQQEFLAEFVDWSNIALFGADKLLVEGLPVQYPTNCDAVYAVLDTAVKGGKQHDGTAVVFFALNEFGIPLTILDWDVVQIDGGLLEHWIPSVFSRLEELARSCGARYGSAGVFAEDTATGSILLQQAANRGWAMRPIDSKLVQAGKDERAVSVSGYYHQEKLKISEYAFNKTVAFKGATRNHLLTQLASFRLGDPEAHKRSDDLLDATVYGIALGLGNKLGF
jgi:hypothetical protein